MQFKGTIYLVGAGPGNPEFLTVKAHAILQRADVVMHDSVVSREILAIAAKADLIDAGRAGYANLVHQKALANQLVGLATEERVVCRLKSGDPFVFGNGGETVNFILQACERSGNSINLEIVPGISSGLGAPASLGLPLTHTGVPNSLCIISGHKEEGVAEHDYSALAKMGTLVIYMPLRTLSQDVAGLLEAGMDKQTPVCIIENGCHASQRVIKTTLESLPQTVAELKVHGPVIFIIGKSIDHWPFAALQAQPAR